MAGKDIVECKIIAARYELKKEGCVRSTMLERECGGPVQSVHKSSSPRNIFSFKSPFCNTVLYRRHCSFYVFIRLKENPKPKSLHDLLVKHEINVSRECRACQNTCLSKILKYFKLKFYKTKEIQHNWKLKASVQINGNVLQIMVW